MLQNATMVIIDNDSCMCMYYTCVYNVRGGVDRRGCTCEFYKNRFLKFTTEL